MSRPEDNASTSSGGIMRLLTTEQPVTPTTPKIATVGVAEIFAPLPPLEWRIAGLKIAPAVTIALCGYGYSGKSLFAQELAISVASGKPVFGLFPVNSGPTLHLDYEQGRRITSERYQRQARAKGIDPAELADSLRLAVLPDVTMPGGVDRFRRTIEGFALVVIDSLRAVAPDLDENSSEMRRAIDPLGKIAEETGASIVVVHHGRKDDPTRKGSAKQSMRGSSAIFDAFSSVYMMSGEKGEPVEVKHEKCRMSGVEIDDFRIEIEDVNERADGSGDPRWGLRLRHLGAEEWKRREASKRPANGNGKSTVVHGAG
jgi:hypothetical protein